MQQLKSLLFNVSGFTKQVGSMTVARSISLLGALVVMMVLTRILDESGYGQYQKIWLLFTLLSPAFISTAVDSLYYRGGAADRKSNPVWVIIGLLSISGLVISLIAYFGAGFWAATFNAPELEPVFRIFSIYIFLATVAGITEPIFILIERKKWLIGYNIVYNIIDASLIILPFLMGYPLVQVVQFMIIGPALRLIFTLFLAMKFTGDVDSPELSKELKLTAMYAGGILVVGFFKLMIFEADKLVVSIFMEDDADFATYVVGAKKIPFMLALIASVSSAFIVRHAKHLSARNYEAVIPSIAHTTNRLFLLIMPVIVFSFIFAEEILVILFEKYAHSAPIFRIYISAMILNLFLSDTVMLASGDSGKFARVTALELTLNIVLSILLIIPLGLIGPALATLMARSINISICHWYCTHVYKIPVSIFLPGRPSAILLLTLPLIVLSYFIFALPGWHPYITMVLTGSVALGIVLWQNKGIAVSS